MTLPRVSVGIPVFNGETGLRKALTSIVYQSHKDLEIIISNNCSTDNSLKIIQLFQNKDPRIFVFNQEKKLSISENFKFVLDKSNSKYFTWASCDDFRSRDFIKKNLEFLIQNTDYVASISPARFFKYSYNSNKIGDFTINGNSAKKRLFDGLELNANARFFSLFRTDLLKSYKNINNNYLGYDFGYIIHMLIIGKFKKINEEKIILGKSGESNGSDLFKKYQKNTLDFLMPFTNLLKTTLNITNEKNLKFLIFIKIMKFNYIANILRLKRLILRIKNF